MARKLSVNFDAMENTIRQYEESADDFKNMLSTLNKSVNVLRDSGWKSGASEAYFSSYDETWKKNMEDHLKIIEFMRDCLRDAVNDYKSLENDINEVYNSLDF